MNNFDIAIAEIGALRRRLDEVKRERDRFANLLCRASETVANCCNCIHHAGDSLESEIEDALKKHKEH